MNGYSQYKEKSIYSMSGPELLLLLFDEAIKRLTRAEISLKDKNYSDFDDCLQRTSRIVRYLTDILDMRQPISHDLRRIYTYLVYDLSMVKAGRERRQEEIGRIRHILSELREGFDGASKQVNDMHLVLEKEIRG
ncbi:MAG: flagellar protein FliS [Lachnospiraceae bacterium]|jgi:flagellar protein FliS|nr:flagellar protein FliS [Lachnospiraceae bacterium]MDE7057906.1 flagellar protein FliS [Lachnospiraceae bacterium]